MEDAAKSLSQLQQQQLQQMLMQQQRRQQMLMQQQRRQRQFLLLQQLQKQQQQAAAISLFPSNIDTHLRPPGITRRPIQLKTVPNVPQQQQQHQLTLRQHQQQNLQQQQQQIQQKVIRPGNQLDFQMACQYAWRVCHPDFKLPFSSLEDACEK